MEGHTFDGRDTLSRDKWEGLREGKPVEVFYRPRNPQSNRLAEDDAWLLRIVMGAAGSVLAVFGGALLAGKLARTRR